MDDTEDTELRAAFDRFDTDGDGTIDADEFARLLDAIGVKMTDNEVYVGFHAIDINASGRIDFGEFRQWWTKRK